MIMVVMLITSYSWMNIVVMNMVVVVMIGDSWCSEGDGGDANDLEMMYYNDFGGGDESGDDSCYVDIMVVMRSCSTTGIEVKMIMVVVVI